jgi:hypothetical protein
MNIIRLQTQFAAAFLLCVSATAASSSGMQYAHTFALGGVGAAGIMSDGETALRAVLSEADAAAHLERMLPHATDAGCLYILVGLRLRDRAAYKRALAFCSQHESIVDTMRGCIVDRESFRGIVHEIDRGNFDVLIKQHPW